MYVLSRRVAECDEQTRIMQVDRNMTLDSNDINILPRISIALEVTPARNMRMHLVDRAAR